MTKKQKITLVVSLFMLFAIPVSVFLALGPVNLLPRATSPATTPTIPIISPTPPFAQLSTRVFVTSTSYNGNLGGLVGADAKCQERAQVANLGGIWKAWLSDSTNSSASRLNHNTGSYRLINDTVIANSWSNLIDSSNPVVIKVSENGTNVSDSLVWTDTNTDGLITASGNSCNNWTNGTSQYYGNGGNTGFRACSVLPSGQTSCVTWTTKYGANCNETFGRLYCFEQPGSYTVTPTPIRILTPTPTPTRVPTATPTPTKAPVPTFIPTSTPTPTPVPISNMNPVIQTTSLPVGRWLTDYKASASGYDLNINDILTMKITGLPFGLSQAPCNLWKTTDRVNIACAIYGRPLATGTYKVNLTIKDNRGGVITKIVNLTVNASLPRFTFPRFTMPKFFGR